MADVVTTEPDGAASEVTAAALEPAVDPQLEKYMTIILQQRQQEKQVGLTLKESVLLNASCGLQG